MMVLYIVMDDPSGLVVTEGFATSLLAAAFIRTAPPGWNRALATNYDDVKEVLNVLDTVEQQMRFLVSLGYSRDRIIATVMAQFPAVPEVDLNICFEEAVASHAELEARLDELVRQESQPAVRAEHDLSQTMHEEGR